MIWHDKSIKEIEHELSADMKNGLSEKEAGQRLKKYGENVIVTKKPDGFFKKFIAQFKDFMIVILLAAAAISFVTSLMNGDADYVDPVIILGIVVFNAIIGVIQENKAEKSIEALKKISSPTALVKRDGKIISVPARELVPGDIVVLKTGNKVSADCRILSSTGLMTDESMLTGESLPAEKIESVCDTHSPLAERKNMLWSGSMVVAGKGEAIVCSVGMNTEMGHIATMIISADTRETPLSKKLSEIGRTLGIAALLICAVIFVIGLFRNIEPFDMFMTAVSLAVAAIPEGLPAIVTIMLAIGVQRMAKRGSIVRNLPSVETLGSASVICSDKTGTLTENKMTVTRVYGADKKTAVKFAVVCSDEESVNPTESAILEYAKNNGCDKKELDSRFKRISEVPFDSEKKYMSVVCREGSVTRSVTKGAPDVVLKMCGYAYDGQRAVPMSSAERKKIIAENEKMAESALRVIAVAYKNVSDGRAAEAGLVFAGLIGMQDPPRAEVKDAVSVCRSAGITPVMITGDHLATAKAVAAEIGMLPPGKKAMTGSELESMSNDELEKRVSDYAVYARVTPSHKVRIVKAWQRRGAVVAMTGDGVNDAPALKTADIGCSMGIAGTDVAKNASDMILTDDNFATIVQAVRQGRGIFSNIKKAVQFLLSSNIGEILTVFLGLLFGWQTPLLAIQLLWVNLVTDSLPAIALGVDPPDKYIMHEPPRHRDKSIFADGLWLAIALEGAMIGALALLAFIIGGVYFDIVIARTMAFSVLSLSQLVHAFNMRSEHSVFSVGLLSNKYLVGAFLIGVLLQCSVVSIAPLAALFKVTPLSGIQWLIVTVLAVAPLTIVELQKLVTAKFHRGGRTNDSSCRKSELRKDHAF